MSVATVIAVSGNVFFEPLYRALPGEFRGLFIVARRGVIMETVIGVRINVSLIDFSIFLQGRLISWPTRIDVIVMLGKLQQQRCFYLRNISRRNLTSVEWQEAASSGYATAAALDTPPP